MTKIVYHFPDYFSDCEWEISAKGWFSDGHLEAEGKKYKLNFYDPTRLLQTVQDEIERNGFFLDENTFVVGIVNRASIIDAIDKLSSFEIEKLVEINGTSGY